jgi:hypothetical protein
MHGNEICDFPALLYNAKTLSYPVREPFLEGTFAKS